ncbi:M23 family metallopeptidase [Sphingomonas sp. MS122]|uniref:M23 family metallopeptidase n=1 Tax=Sphingomonas sp. MS122 TaxID=3412683 RepID=UPI003C2D90B6
MIRFPPLAALALVAPVSAQMPISAELTLLAPPATLVRADGTQIAYEIRVASFHRSPMRLQTLEILDGEGRPLARYEGTQLTALIGGQWMAEDADRTLLAPAAHALVFVNMPVARPVAAVRHRLTYTVGERPPVTVESASRAVAPAPRPFGPPLRGGTWSAIYAPAMEFGHRRYVYAAGGVPRVPGRFAVDFFHAERNPKEPRYAADPGFGAEVIAVADGTVVAARDDFADPVQRDPEERVAPENATGNYLALDIGANESGGRRIVFYEHLKQGLAVKRGDRVRRGQLLGRVGATGQVGGTHLHFHVADTNSPLGAEGLPFSLAAFEQVGAWKTIDQAFSGERWQSTAPRRFTNAMPSPNVVARFP